MKKVYKITINNIENGDKNHIIEPEDIHIKTLGVLIHNTTRYDSRTHISETYGKIKTYDSDYLTNNVKSIYRFPRLKLSRDKLSLLQEKCNFKIIRDSNKADLCVVSEKYFDKLTDSDWAKSDTVEDYINNLNNFIYSLSGKTWKIEDIMSNEAKKKIIDILSNYDPKSIVISHNVPYFYNCNKLSNVEAIMKYFDRGNNQYVHWQDQESYDWCVNNFDKLITDENLNKLCTEDSVSLSNDDYNQIQQLIISRDQENVSVGLTMMANCDVENSHTQLALLFTFYDEHMKKNKVWNQVNFKYLRDLFHKFIGITCGSWAHSYNHVINYLVEDDALTLWSSRIVAAEMFKNVLEQNYGVDDAVFTINADSLQLNDRYKNKLKDDSDNKLSEMLREKRALPFS